MRPAALAASLALFLVSAALALVLASGTSASNGEEYATLGEVMVAERDVRGDVHAGADAGRSGAARDSGSRR